jgi:hypothetical protein
MFKSAFPRLTFPFRSLDHCESPGAIAVAGRRVEVLQDHGEDGAEADHWRRLVIVDDDYSRLGVANTYFRPQD